MINKEKLLEDLDVLTEFDKNDFEHFSEPEPEFTAVTLNAVLYYGRWIPKSQMRCDFDGNLYIANWLAMKL
jgi:hypothetical protein